MIDPKYQQFATPRQLEVLDAYNRCGGSSDKAGELLGMSGRNVRYALNAVKIKAADRGYDPSTGRDYSGPNQHIISGYSELVRAPDDDPLQRIIYWVKTNRKFSEQLAECQIAAEAMSYDIPKSLPIKYIGNVKTKNHFSVIPVGDPHIGLRTWAKEVGENWDVEIAMRVYRKVFERLLARAPDTEEVILFNSGDFFHADNIRGETERSGHKLDLDGRPGYWLEAGVVIMRMLIDMCLAKYKKVHFVNTPGNHDDILGQAIGVFCKHFYEDNKRFTCQIGTNPFQFVERGKVAIGFCHGHTCRLPSLPGKMADDECEMWGRTTYRHWFTGHVHHNQWVQFKEHPGCTVESVGIIPPKDAYAHGGGYGAKRGQQVCVFDKRGFMPDRFCETVWPTD